MAKRMDILVTSGGTRENIDAVRSITNHSTGRLGALVAARFLESGGRVTYLHGENAAVPEHLAPGDQCRFEAFEIQNTAQLNEKIELLLRSRSYDCFIHAMAVSDFTPQAAVPLREIAGLIEHADYEGGEKLYEYLTQIGATGVQQQKISSSEPYMALILKQTPKTIKIIKEIQPNTILVGFKLLSNVTEQELTEAAKRLMDKNRCDFVLANDLAGISADTHKALLLGGQGIVSRAETKHEIARMIFDAVSKKLES